MPQLHTIEGNQGFDVQIVMPEGVEVTEPLATTVFEYRVLQQMIEDKRKAIEKEVGARLDAIINSPRGVSIQFTTVEEVDAFFHDILKWADLEGLFSWTTVLKEGGRYGEMMYLTFESQKFLTRQRSGGPDHLHFERRAQYVLTSHDVAKMLKKMAGIYS